MRVILQGEKGKSGAITADQLTEARNRISNYAVVCRCSILHFQHLGYGNVILKIGSYKSTIKVNVIF